MSPVAGPGTAWTEDFWLRIVSIPRESQCLPYRDFCILKIINSPFGEKSKWGSEYEIKETNVQNFMSLQSSLLCIVGDLAGVGSVAVAVGVGDT